MCRIQAVRKFQLVLFSAKARGGIEGRGRSGAARLGIEGAGLFGITGICACVLLLLMITGCITLTGCKILLFMGIKGVCIGCGFLTGDDDDGGGSNILFGISTCLTGGGGGGGGWYRLLLLLIFVVNCP